MKEYHTSREQMAKVAVFVAKKAYRVASLEPFDNRVAEVYDSCTIAEIIGREDLVFFSKNEMRAPLLKKGRQK